MKKEAMGHLDTHSFFCIGGMEPMRYKPEGLEANLSQAKKSEALKFASHFCRWIESSGFFVFELNIFRNLAVNFTSNLPFV